MITYKKDAYGEGPLSRDKEAERHRLCALTATLDPVSMKVLDTVGVRRGWHCLEIGSGTGTMAQYLLGRVGPGGRVVATELDPGLLTTAGACGAEVLRHDVVEDDFPAGHFDLVHARCVFEHIDRRFREATLAKVVRWLKPGGRLVVEAAGFESERPDRSSTVGRAVDIVSRFFAEVMGTDLHWPRTLGPTMASLGLQDVDVTRSRMVVGRHGPADQVMVLTLRQNESELIGSGLLDEGFVDRLERHLDGAGAPESMSTLYSVSGRKPVPARSGTGTEGVE
ncbi:class I SAM-dependent methyltransferase [Streptomyces sp. NPDC091377]|uniref:class I SAM-dependent methyltransferase n=1 Tax=Streptomyces sp. NPDC091377 TaxID=3365995 RepID=UPI0037FE5077